MARPEVDVVEHAPTGRRPARRRSHSGGVRDWTPIVLVVATLSLGTVGMVWLADRLRLGRADSVEPEPGPVLAERGAPGEVDLWVGEPKPGGVKLVLTSVWGDADPDRQHDADLRSGLSLPEKSTLAWYTLLLFNLSTEPRTVPLTDGALVLDAHGDPAHLLSLPDLMRRQQAHPSPALAAVLKGLGALTEEVALPPGDSAQVLVCFDRRVDLGAAHSLEASDGTAFRQRRIHRRALQRLIAAPDEVEVKDL